MKLLINLVMLLSFILGLVSPVYAVIPADTYIATQVQNKIMADGITANLDATFTSDNGIVSFAGNVDTIAQAAELVEIAESIDGVQDVDTSKLSIKEGKDQFVDASITAKIKGILTRNRIFGIKTVKDIGLNIETINGVVYLTGTVDDADQLAKVVELAKLISGVKEIDSKVTIGKNTSPVSNEL